MPQNCVLSTLLTWSLRRWVVALAAGLGTFLLLGVPTAVVANPVFDRTIAPTPWAMEVLLATSALVGLLTATYVRNDGPALIRTPVADVSADERTSRRGALGGLLVILAIRVFAPVQTYLAVAGIVALSWVLVVRLRGEMTCALGTGPEQGR